MDELEEDIANKQNESLAAFDKMDLAKAYDKLFEILWYSQVNIYSLHHKHYNDVKRPFDIHSFVKKI